MVQGTSAKTTNSKVSIGSTSLSAVNIKGVQTNLETTTLNLNTNGTGNTLIGTSGGSNNITINRPLTPAYSYVAGTGTPTVTYGTGAGKIGEIKYNIVRVTQTTTATSGQTIASLTVDSAGIYLLTFNAQFIYTAPATSGYFYLVISGASDPYLYASNIGITTILVTGAPYYYGCGNSWILQPSGSATYSIVTQGVPVGMVTDFLNIKTVRIA